MGMKLDGPVVVAVVEDVMMRVGMASAASRQVGLQSHNDQRRDHGDQARERFISLAEDIWQARVGQGYECRREKVDEGCRDENACTEMLA
jgi:hypothetical protein